MTDSTREKYLQLKKIKRKLIVLMCSLHCGKSLLSGVEKQNGFQLSKVADKVFLKLCFVLNC